MAQYEKLELTADDVIGDVNKTLHQWIWEAYKEAAKEDIKANTVIINKHFAKVNAHIFNFNGRVLDMPPMICGLEVRLSEEFPEGYDFALCEAYETERDRLIRNTKAEVARGIFEEIEKVLTDNEVYFRQTDEMREAFYELKKKYRRTSQWKINA